MNWKIRGEPSDTKEGREGDPHQHSFLDVRFPGSPERDYSRLSKGVWGPCLFPTRFVASAATSLATRADVASLLRSVRIAEKISMKIDVKDPSCALIAMVPTLYRLKIAWSGRRRRRFNESALGNAYPFRKPDIWLKPRCWLPPEESPNLLNARHL